MHGGIPFQEHGRVLHGRRAHHPRLLAGGGLAAAFDRGDGVALFRPSRLASVETVYAMTVHKSQGSQFATTAVLLPPATSPLLTRELLYTAVTQARERMLLVGTRDAIAAAAERPAARPSGLGPRLRAP